MASTTRAPPPPHTHPIETHARLISNESLVVLGLKVVSDGVFAAASVVIDGQHRARAKW